MDFKVFWTASKRMLIYGCEIILMWLHSLRTDAFILDNLKAMSSFIARVMLNVYK